METPTPSPAVEVPFQPRWSWFTFAAALLCGASLFLCGLGSAEPFNWEGAPARLVVFSGAGIAFNLLRRILLGWEHRCLARQVGLDAVALPLGLVLGFFVGRYVLMLVLAVALALFGAHP